MKGGDKECSRGLHFSFSLLPLFSSFTMLPMRVSGGAMGLQAIVRVRHKTATLQRSIVNSTNLIVIGTPSANLYASSVKALKILVMNVVSDK
jgi:hypothetical protein